MLLTRLRPAGMMWGGQVLQGGGAVDALCELSTVFQDGAPFLFKGCYAAPKQAVLQASTFLGPQIQLVMTSSTVTQQNNNS